MGHVGVLLLVLVLVCGSAMAAPSCSQVTVEIAPCLGYLTAKERDPSKACCGGVVELKAMGKTQGDRRAICNCLKQEAGMIRDLDGNNAASLPARCKVEGVPTITLDIDCSKIP